MKLLKFAQPNQFYDFAKDYLLINEPHNCLPLAIAQTLVQHPQRYNCQPYLTVVESAGKVVAIAMRTPPYKLVLSKIADIDALELIAEDLYSHQVELPGFSSLAQEASTFAQIWHKLTDQASQLVMQMRIHQLHTVQNVPRSKGYLRRAVGRNSDRDLLIKWYKAFDTEAMTNMGGTPENIEKIVDYHLQQNAAYIWEDEVPVSMVFCAGSTPNSKRIGPVYTPPEYRQRGYATTSVAELTQRLLTDGSQFCCLFTNLANPTSNKIYHQIGYLPVADWHEYKLG
ncbi:MAG: GNAT family N-acetyltransferase [Calothrix sp. MO_167.B42]|nr:GNAT family N-acetyltransferase [Calothrix sp. MO_167.B42]